MGQLKNRRRFTSTLKIELLEALRTLSKTTRIDMSRYLDEAVEDLLKKYDIKINSNEKWDVFWEKINLIGGYMKLVETVVKTLVYFNTEGQITPIAFVYQGQKYYVKKIIRSWVSHNYQWYHHITYTVQVYPKHNKRDERLCDLKYIREENAWVLVKI